jgi:hypothetical protein
MAPITKFLGYAGLVPFIVLSGLVQFAEPPLDFWAANSLLLYGATIASFVGALHWGPLIGHQPDPEDRNFWHSKGAWVWGVTPALFAWVALHLTFSSGYYVIAITLLIALLVDRKQFHNLITDESYLEEFLQMRTVLTLIAAASLIWAGIAVPQM